MNLMDLKYFRNPSSPLVPTLQLPFHPLVFPSYLKPSQPSSPPPLADSDQRRPNFPSTPTSLPIPLFVPATSGCNPLSYNLTHLNEASSKCTCPSRSRHYIFLPASWRCNPKRALDTTGVRMRGP